MNITIVGPRSVGKSTLSKILASKLKLRYVESDALMNDELKEHGGLTEVIGKGKTEIIMRVGPRVVSDVLSQNNLIYDLAGGALSSIKGTRMGVCQKIINTINKRSIVIGLLPSKNDEESVKLLYNRERKRLHFKGMSSKELRLKVEEDYLRLKPVLKKTADIMIYAGKRKPAHIIEEIIKKMNKLNN